MIFSIDSLAAVDTGERQQRARLIRTFRNQLKKHPIQRDVRNDDLLRQIYYRQGLTELLNYILSNPDKDPKEAREEFLKKLFRMSTACKYRINPFTYMYEAVKEELCCY